MGESNEDKELMKLRAKARELGSQTWVDICDKALDGEPMAVLAARRVIATKDYSILECKRGKCT